MLVDLVAFTILWGHDLSISHLEDADLVFFQFPFLSIYNNKEKIIRKKDIIIRALFYFGATTIVLSSIGPHANVGALPLSNDYSTQLNLAQVSVHHTKQHTYTLCLSACTLLIIFVSLFRMKRLSNKPTLPKTMLLNSVFWPRQMAWRMKNSSSLCSTLRPRLLHFMCTTTFLEI